MSDGRFEVLLFDLGGVLVEFDGITPLVALSGGALTREQARRFWLLSDAVRRFETGRCNGEEFAAGVITELRLNIAPDLFLQQFVSWDSGPMPGALELLDSLKPRFLLACLSNNNELHWRRLREETGLLEKFHHCFASQEIGHMKPDRESFEHVVRNLGVAPDRILFLDDNPECVDGARAAGLVASCARGVDGVRTALASFGVSL
ncbi:MAG: HAD-IA family hydrolase [Verrucomicrobia bacterium]|nr:HAD-IA family hydrolase [Verrucomicrobiota bacterium]